MNDGNELRQLGLVPDILGTKEKSQFKYSKSGFRNNLIIALGLTALFCALVWMILGIYGSNYMNIFTALTGLMFFAFISARTIILYFKDEIVMAVQPNGVYDRRIGDELISWDEIKELVLIRKEQDYALKIVLWPTNNNADTQKTYLSNLSTLQGGSEPVLNAISQFKNIRMER